MVKTAQVSQDPPEEVDIIHDALIDTITSTKYNLVIQEVLISVLS